MNPYYEDDAVTIYHGDCIATMRTLPSESVDAIVTDPPYGLGFMGQKWDALPPGREWAEACLRVLKPGGHLLAFGGTRTYHRLTCAIEDAGFEIRDTICWLYGSGFPKSLDVSKAIDKAAGAEREVVGYRSPFPPDHPRPNKDLARMATARARGAAASTAFSGVGDGSDLTAEGVKVTAPATPEAERWDGWGTALKPAHEPIVVARKPLVGTVAANVLEHGTGALNIDGCRIAHDAESLAWIEKWSGHGGHSDDSPTHGKGIGDVFGGSPMGRWPANVVLDEEAAAMLDEQTGELHSQDPATRRSRSNAQGVTEMGTGASVEYADRGGASRFFYCAKASRRERGQDNAHPTVKPLALMRWLIQLVTPPRAVLLDPFAGSGTTLLAAHRVGVHAIGIEVDERYCEIAAQRCAQDVFQFALADAA